jgi:hypothetical protein
LVQWSGGFFKPRAFVKAFWEGVGAAKRVIPELAKLSVLLENWERVFTVYNTICFPLMMKRFAKQFEDWYPQAALKSIPICISPCK